MADRARHDGLDIVCRDVVNLATEFLDCALRDVRRARFEAHLAECEDCRAYLSQLLTVIRVAGQMPRAGLAPSARIRAVETFRGWHEERNRGATKPLAE